MSTDVGKSEVKGGSVAEESTEHVRIDVEELQEIRRKGTGGFRFNFANVYIFEVQSSLKDLKKDVYVPKVVGLGPLHHDDPLPHDNLNELKKKAVVESLGKICWALPLPDKLEKLRKVVTDMKVEIQKCYHQTTLSFDPDIFILDSCFLLEFLLSPFSFIPHKSKASYSEIKRDLMKLENQIPLILLQKLLSLQGHNADDMVVNISTKLFGNFFVRGPLETSLRAFSKIEKRPRHLLEYGQQFVSGFIRDATALEGNNDEEKGWCARFSTKKSENNHSSWSFPAVGCALFNTKKSEDDDDIETETGTESETETGTESETDIMGSFPAHELGEVGIELKRSENLFFEQKWWGLKGVLNIPRFTIGDSTEVGLKNIIAFEQCLPPKERLVTMFMGFLDGLIDENTDVGVLRRAKIIDNLPESDRAVTDLVNSSCVNVAAPDNLKFLKKRIKAYQSSSWRMMMQEFIDTHLSKPWLLFGTVAAVLLLALTIVQTIYTVMSYKAGE